MCDDADVIVFFDDDFFPARDYLRNVEALMLETRPSRSQRAPSSRMASTGPAWRPSMLAGAWRPAHCRLPGKALIPYYGAYGCNMVVRLSHVRDHRLAFDEALPLYSWQEDIDFSRQIAPFGQIVKAEALTGIHLGAKRWPHFGRATAATPRSPIPFTSPARELYRCRSPDRTLAKNLLANVGRLHRPQPHIDRPGRLKGNILALLDLLRGRLHPARVLEIGD